MTRILFVGNSHTYTNDMPFIVKGMWECATGDNTVSIAEVASLSVSLQWHSEQAATRGNIRFGGWDYVVIQQVSQPFSGVEALLREAGMLIDELIVPSGARPIAFLTWPRKDQPEKQHELTLAYQELCRQHAALLAPVGIAWDITKRAWPQIELYALDGGHASIAGSYLTSLVFMRVLTDRDIIGLPAKVSVNGIVLADIETNIAHHLQVAASQAFGHVGTRQ